MNFYCDGAFGFTSWLPGSFLELLPPAPVTALRPSKATRSISSRLRLIPGCCIFMISILAASRPASFHFNGLAPRTNKHHSFLANPAFWSEIYAWPEVFHLGRSSFGFRVSVSLPYVTLFTGLSLAFQLVVIVK